MLELKLIRVSEKEHPDVLFPGSLPSHWFYVSWWYLQYVSNEDIIVLHWAIKT